MRQIGPFRSVVTSAGVLLLWASQAWAAGVGGMPFDAPLTALFASVQSSYAPAGIFIALVGSAVAWAFTQHDSVFRWVLGIFVAGSLAGFGATVILPLFGLTAGLVLP